MEVARLSDIQGIKIGNSQDMDAATGCTVILCEQGAVAGVDVRGGAPGTRETDLLRPENYVEKIHGLLLAGGSAFGLDAAAGVMAYLEERNIGFDVGVARVPIVAGAVLFDLVCGNPRIRPDKAMGYEACLQAQSGIWTEGSAGAGTGATVGKGHGMERAMKGGLGSCCFRVGDVLVGALVAVNCLGDVIDPVNGQVVAGACRRDTGELLDSEAGLMAALQGGGDPFRGNTSIGAVMTNVALTKAQAGKIASMAHNGYARTMRPAHTLYDGDTIFTLSVGDLVADVNAVGMLAARAVEGAVLSAVRQASALAGFPAWRDGRKRE
ncbi:MAG TPA: P1 family peptidase [Patescibacteria group bacterium]|nr:P1 family peptidase [Patescibacteria group bacterium]